MDKAILGLLREGKSFDFETMKRRAGVFELSADEVERYRNVKLSDLQDRLFSYIKKEMDSRRRKNPDMPSYDDFPIIFCINPEKDAVCFIGDYTFGVYTVDSLGYKLHENTENCFLEYVKQGQAL